MHSLGPGYGDAARPRNEKSESNSKEGEGQGRSVGFEVWRGRRRRNGGEERGEGENGRRCEDGRKRRQTIEEF